MSTHRASRTLPYSCEQLFDLAADIERYPEYLPGWIDAKILERTDQHLRVEQTLGLKVFPQPFITTAVLDRPQRVSIHSEDGPFSFLQIEWRFEPARPGHCTASLDFNYRLRSGLLELMASAFFDRTSPEIIRRFDQRARQLYGKAIHD